MAFVPIKLYLDEHLDPAIAEGLRRHGVDVLTVREAGRRSLPDEDQLDFAFAEGRVFVTRDADAARLNAKGRAHAGIIFVHSRKRSIGVIIRRILSLWQIAALDDFRGQIWFL